VASEKEQKNDEAGKGFAGFSLMVSDLEELDTLSCASQASSRETKTLSATEHEEPVSTSPQADTWLRDEVPTESTRGSSAGKWLLGICAVILGIWIFSDSGNKVVSTMPAHSNSAQPSRGNSSDRSTAVEIVVPSRNATSAPKGQRPSTSTYQQIPNRQPSIDWNQFEPVYPNSARHQNPGLTFEDKPPVGRNNVLTTTQIQYCLAEKIRMDAAKSALDNYSSSDVSRFNTLVSDYNSRCGEFRYREGTLDHARSEVEAYRSTLQSASSIPTAPKSLTIKDGERVLSLMEQQVGVWTADRYRKAYAAFKAAEKGDPTRRDFWKSKADYAIEMAGELENADSSVSQPDLGGQLTLPDVSRPWPDSTVSAEKQPQSNTSIRLSEPERESIEAACSTDKYVNGPAAYRACVGRQTAALRSGVRRPDLSRLSGAERQSIEAACSTDKYVNGPAAYNNCLASQLHALEHQGARPDLSRLTSSERQSIEASCSTDKYVNGPAAYNACLSRQLMELRN
jgi:hypothetical protein